MPMSVRRWLDVAECFRCGTSIALNFVVRQPPRRERSPVPKRVLADDPKSRADPEIDVDVEPTKVRSLKALPVGVVPPPRARRRRSLWRQLNELLACLASIITHLLLLLLAAMLGWGTEQPVDDVINLSIDVRPDEREQSLITDSEFQPVGFEKPQPTPAEVAEAVEAQQWAEQLQLGPNEPAQNLPPLSRTADALASDDSYRRMLSARDPRIRREIIDKEGGTTLTEAAVARALRWMSRHQADDGSWSLHNFHRCGDCNGQCGNRASLRSDTGGTALVLQAMLGAGQTHRTGIYRDEVSHGLQYLLAVQDTNGDLRGRSSGQSGMYVHALATIALCDAYALTGDESLRDPAQRAVEFVAYAQHRRGGWRYGPRDPGDLSVTGWQLMALHSARAAGLEISTDTLVLASRYLDSVQTDRIGSRYAYQSGNRGTPAMTAEGLLSRMYLGTRRNDRGLAVGVDWLVSEHLPNKRNTNIYYWYYGTQVMHHWGGRPWKRWNEAIRDALVTTQVRTGHEEGSWHPNTPHGGQGGRLYMTVLACCTLEVYYRHAPLFRKIELGSR